MPRRYTKNIPAGSAVDDCLETELSKQEGVTDSPYLVTTIASPLTRPEVGCEAFQLQSS